MTSPECDVSVVVGLLIVFGLPLTLLCPNFSIWKVVPKVQITRFHIISSTNSWVEVNATLLILLTIFFCLYLEIRKRKIDDMVENVLTVSKATDAAMAVEQDRQAAAVKACVRLLDCSSDHYENLVLLREELSRRDKGKGQHPPAIDLSSSSF